MLSPLYRWENWGPQSGSDRSQLSWKGVSSDKTVSEQWRQCLILQPNYGNKGRGYAHIHSPLKSEAIEIFGWGQGQLLSLEGCFWLLHLWNHMEEFHFVLHWDSFMSSSSWMNATRKVSATTSWQWTNEQCLPARSLLMSLCRRVIFLTSGKCWQAWAGYTGLGLLWLTPRALSWEASRPCENQVESSC